MQRWAVMALVLALVACSKDKDIDVPAQLTELKQPTLKVERVWTAAINDKVGAKLRLGLGLAMEGNRVYGASHRGDVVALDLATGRQVWRHRIRVPLSAGPSVSGDVIALGTSEGEVLVLKASDGSIRWRLRLNGEILSAPTISERVIAVRTVDGKIHGLSPQDGHELWSQEQQVPRLSLRGTSRPVINGELAICGFDNGKVMAVNMNDGSVQWEATIAPPHGKTELERLVDVDSTVRVAGEDVYAVGFQGRIAMLARDTGQVWWSHDASSYRSMGLDDEDLYMATADGQIVAMKRRTGAESWRQKALLHRGLSAVAITDSSVITADFQGYVHWLDKATGDQQARVRNGKVRISNAPLVQGNLVVVSNDIGRIAAYRVTPVARPAVKAKGKPTAAPAKPPAPPQPSKADQPQPDKPAQPEADKPAPEADKPAQPEAKPEPQAGKVEPPPAEKPAQPQPGSAEQREADPPKPQT